MQRSSSEEQSSGDWFSHAGNARFDRLTVSS